MAVIDLVTLGEAKQYLRIPATDETQDDLVRSLISLASGVVESHCQNGMIIRAYEEWHRGHWRVDSETATASGWRRLYLRRYPVATVTKISDGAGNLILSTDYIILNDQGILEHFGFWPPAQDAAGNVSRWKIEYTAGRFADVSGVDPVVQSAALALVAMFKARPDLSLASKRVGDFGLSYASLTPGELLPTAIQGLLSPYVSRI